VHETYRGAVSGYYNNVNKWLETKEVQKQIKELKEKPVGQPKINQKYLHTDTQYLD
jgi:hypothetical protein